MDSTGEFRIVFDVAGPHSTFAGSLHQAVPDKEAIIPGTNAQTDDFSIDDENFEGLQPPLDVTLVTYGDFQDSLESLIPLVSHFNGPVSAAIFSPTAAETQLVLEFISQARLCHSPTRKFVSFHLVFPLVETHSRRRAGSPSNFANNNNSSSSGASSPFERWRSEQNKNRQSRLNQISTSSINTNTNKLPLSIMGKSCQSFRDQINKYYKNDGGGESRKGGGNSNNSSSSNRMSSYPNRNTSRSRNRFPVNLLRNVARKRVATEYSFVSNMNMIPSRDLRTSFQQFTRDRVAKSGDDKKTVFVVPAFEIKSEEQIPQVKSELMSLVDKHKARPFQFDLCWKCQVRHDLKLYDMLLCTLRSINLRLSLEL